jgi:enterobactin synthetase component D
MITMLAYKNDYKNMDFQSFKKLFHFDNSDHWHNEKQFEYYLSRYLIFLLVKEKFKLEISSFTKDSKNRPIWPSMIVGSISHSKEAIYLAFGDSKEYLSIGIDIECIERFNGESHKKFVTNDDVKVVLGLNEIELRALVFSSKESLFKLLNPLTDTYFGFEFAAVVEVDTDSKLFTIILLKSINDKFSINGYDKFIGHYDFIDGQVITTLAIKI